MLHKIKNFLLFFYYLDFIYIFSGIKLLLIQILCYATRTLAGTNVTARYFKNIEVILSFKKIKFSVSVMLNDLSFIFECFINKTYESISQFIPKDGYTCLDIGANIGSSVLSWYLNNSSGRMICFEPNPITSKRLQNNISLNNCNNIEVLEVAISNKNGLIDFYCNDNSSMGSIGPALNKVTYSVQAYTLDTIVKMKSLGSIDLIKIDVEGHEVEIIKNAIETLNKTKRLIVEYHDRDKHDEIINLLMQNFIIIKDSSSTCGLIFAENKQV